MDSGEASGRTNIIDSLRPPAAAAFRRGAARAAKRTGPRRCEGAVAGRVLGVGGMLARISRKRGTGRAGQPRCRWRSPSCCSRPPAR
ncbi:MAG: hypothetical protein ACLUW6_04315 [Coriobacteriaceae bacterium]